jgi:hypothetical protein
MPSRRDVLAGTCGLAAATALPAPATADPTERRWNRTYAPHGRSPALVHDILDTGRGYTVVGLAGGPYRSQGWIAGVDQSGRPRWHVREGTGRSAFLAGAPGPDGGVVAAGATNGSADVLADQYTDPYVLRAGPDGEVAWARTYQPASPAGQSKDIARIDGGYVVAGSAADSHERPWAAGIDTNGTRSWSWTGERAGGANAAVAVRDGVVVGGSTWPPGADTPDPRGRLESAWITRIADSGDVDWRWRVDREGGDRIEALAPGPDGGVVAVGRRGFATDDRGVGWLVALDADGTRLWDRTYPREGWNWHHDLAATGDGYALVGTLQQGSDVSDRGVWLLGVDAAGRVDREYRGAAETRGYAVHSLADGGFLVGGDSQAGSRDRGVAWLAKVGGEPSGAGPRLDVPSLPDWTGPFLAGGVLGAAAAGAVAYRRRS